jgi:hypothetical protein
MNHFLVVFAFFFAALTGLQPLAQAVSSPCNGPNGSLFNLEPRPNAVVQVARSIAVLPTPAGNNDLVVPVGADGSAPIISEDAFYAERSGSDCTPDLEGGLLSILTPENQHFIPIEGVPSVIADSARSDMGFPDLALASGLFIQVDAR